MRNLIWYHRVGAGGASRLLIIPKLMGYEEMAVLTGSMEPKYPVGTLIFVKEADPNTLEVGDVITYHLDSNTVVTHRIVEIDKEGQTVTTKGDANNANDGNPVPYSEIVGKEHFKIPYCSIRQSFSSYNFKLP